VPQETLFPIAVEIEPCDPHVSDDDRPRMSDQCVAIFNRLRHGPANNTELATIALKYTSRISDLRAAGYNVVCDRLGGGLTSYRLVTPEAVTA
jgi:hypothetical protein